MLRRALAVLAIATAACSGPAKASYSPATNVSTPRPGHREFNVQVRLEMTVSGDTELGPLTTEADLRVVEIQGGSNPREIWFYSASPGRPVEIDGSRLLLFSADLAPGIYEGPGTYELSDEAGVTLGGEAGLSSGAYVQVYRVAEPGVSKREIRRSFRRYDRFGEPCTLTVAADSVTGTVDCPSLLDEDGDTVALHWEWTRI